MTVRVLIAEDDLSLLQLVSEYLRSTGCEPVPETNGRSALERFRHERFDLVILDIMLPGLDGVSVLKRIREVSEVPVVMLTAMEAEEMQVGAFEARADDYVTKPFSPRVLMKRVQAVLRRAGSNLDPAAVEVCGIRIDGSCYKAFHEGVDLELTVTEFELLQELARCRGRVLSRQQLLDALWGYDYFGEDRVVDAHIKNLRRKLPADIIRTVKGVGYALEARP